MWVGSGERKGRAGSFQGNGAGDIKAWLHREVQFKSGRR